MAASWADSREADVQPNLSDVTDLYGAAYQADSIAAERQPAWSHIADQLVATFPKADYWLDVGCGAGPLVLELRRRGKAAWGIEGSLAAIGLVDVPIIVWDLRVPLTVLAPFDVVTCFDTAEHVGNADAVADTCACATKRALVFGAATPGQEGLGHVDCRPYGDWHERFAARGLHLNETATEDLRARIRANDVHNKIWWLEKNAHVYERRTNGA